MQCLILKQTIFEYELKCSLTRFQKITACLNMPEEGQGGREEQVGGGRRGREGERGKEGGREIIKGAKEERASEREKSVGKN